MDSVQVYNLARALKGLYPLQTSWNGIAIKLLDVFRSEKCTDAKNYKVGFVMYDKTENILKVLCIDRKWLCVRRVCVTGKPIMSAIDFNNGYINQVDVNRRYFK